MTEQDRVITATRIITWLKMISHWHGLTKITKIEETLGEITPKAITTTRDRYSYEGQALHNLYCRVDGKQLDLPPRVICAHHDVANLQSENCLDNNASVLNLCLIYEAMQRIQPKQTVLLAWTDAEESCNPGKMGIVHLLKNTQVRDVLDLELTAFGDTPAISHYTLIPHNFGSECHTIRQPFNQAWIAAKFVESSACLTLFDDKAKKEMTMMGRCQHWSAIHSINDTVDAWANPQDMLNLAQKIAQHYSL